jgi:DNA-binding response OmpR family regulator
MARILLVEDDATVRELVTLALEAEHHDVRGVATGRAALAAWADDAPDLVLLDVMLPEVDGVEVCRRIRARDEDTPIVMLTARTDPIDVVLGLETGADDYVTKPFETRVLLARVKAALRRAPDVAPGTAATHDRVRAGAVEVDMDARTATVDGRPVQLTRTEWLLLAELAQHAGQVLSREQLLERVWGYDYAGDTRLVDVGISRLRAKVEADPTDPRVVRTRRGFGYVLAAT